MTREEFYELTDGRFLYLDGATGSNLQKRGMGAGVCPEQWILEHRDALAGLQREYVEAGSQIIYAPTFSANRIKLKEYGLEEKVSSINRELARLSGEAVGAKALIAGNLTMTGRQLAPVGTLDFEELIDIYKEQIVALCEGGVDLLAVETMMSLQETRAALIAAKECCSLPVMATMTFEADGRSLFGTDALTAAVTLESLGAAAVGVNCSAGPDKMAAIVARMAQAVRVPVIAKPNAGLPSLDAQGNTVYDMPPERFAEQMLLLTDAGASILGGCCGTSPEYIRLLRERTADRRPVKRAAESKRYLTSERAALCFEPDSPFIIIGERINPTGKKALQAQLKEGSFELVTQYAVEQEENGAGVLDVNVGMSGIDEKETMLQAIEEVTQVSSLPLSIDSSSADVVEAALRRYPGRALLNSVSLEQERIEKFLPAAVKYGAMIILLPLSDKGLPASLEEKKQIIDAVAERAFALGMEKKDILVDGLVATVGANPRAALETLETIRYCKQAGFATVCGLSNISFGLPERGYVNAAFLTMAIREGLNMAIANPGQELLTACAFASDLLLAREEGDIRFIERMSLKKERRGAETAEGQNRAQQTLPTGEQTPQKELTAQEQSAQEEQTAQKKLREAVLKGDRKHAAAIAQAAVESGIGPERLLDECLLPAINEVGELFDRGSYFLPQLISGAEAMKRAVEYLEPLLAGGGERRKLPAIVLATVEGDIHDIGKNLVALMLKNYGFDVIDLGKDVPGLEIIRAAKEHGAKIIALSALMTTTMQQMRHVIALRNEAGLNAYVMVGGAVVTREYADEIGADGYSTDAADAVRVARRLLNL